MAVVLNIFFNMILPGHARAADGRSPAGPPVMVREEEIAH